MSTIQVANVQLESTGNNRVQYLGSNTVAVVAGGANAIVANGTQVQIYANGTTGTSGQVLATNGTSIFWGAASNVQSFAASGTWTKPAAGTLALIQVWGGGGSGGANGGGGGGGGGFAQKIVLLSTLGATETVTVGTGGVASNSTNNGSVGGTTTFGSWLTAYGGGPGKAQANGGYGGEGGNPFAVCVTNANGRPSFMIYRIPILSSSSSGCPPTSSYASTGGFAYGSGAGKILTVSGGALSDHSDGTGMMGFGGGGGGGVNSNSGSQGTYTGFSLYGNTAAVDGYAINISGFVRANGAIALEGGSGGGGGKSTGALAVGGTGGGGGNGGAGGNNTTAAVNGSVPGGGGGGGPNSSNSIAVSAAGGNGQCIVIVI